jgi:ribosomal protein S18 acetylase RimI-like enzyme
MPHSTHAESARPQVPAELVQADHLQTAQRWRLHHQVWGEGFELPLYLKREEALLAAEFCHARHRMWLLQGEDGQVLASAETYLGHMSGLQLTGAVVPLRLETIASVVVDPRLRNQGYAARLMQELDARLRFEGTQVATLYSDVGPALYRKAGYLLHPARESVRTVAGEAWPDGATELGIGDVADVLRDEAEHVQGWLLSGAMPAVAEVATADRVAWFHVRSQYRAWARGQTPPQVVGALGPDGGCVLWTADACDPVVHTLLWRPRTPRDARVLADAAAAHTVELGLRQVVWWDADRDTGLDPYRQPERQPAGAVARARESSLPMLSWLADGQFPMLWMGIERFGWA